MRRRIFAAAIWFVSFAAATTGIHAQTFPYPSLPADTSTFGQYIQRSMELMHSSTPEQRNTVRVMVYGQSLSEQSWSDSIYETLVSKFPHADIEYRNSSVGGFSSQILWQTTKMDMLEFYPDLVIFHVFGHHKYYDTILQYTLQHTAAEMAIWTDPHEGDWADQMSYTFIPSYTGKYNLELMQIRDRWAGYLAEHNLTRNDVTRDGTHFNDHGNFLLANLLKPYFSRKKKWEADPFGRVVTYEVGKDIDWNGDTLWLPFAGNRVDVVTGAAYEGGGSGAEVWIDGQRPSAIPELYNHTRPGKGPGEAWAWTNPVFLRHFNSAPWQEEHWTLTLDSLSSDYAYAGFHLEGSLTGPDGKGNTRDDFTSNSGRVIIHGGQAADDPYWGAWHLKRTHDVTGRTFSEGQTIEWDTYLMGMDVYTPTAVDDPAIENATTLAQGLTNSYHVLKLTRKGKGEVPIEKVRIYRPYLDRSEPTAGLSLSTQEISASPQDDQQIIFQVQSDTRWQAGLLPQWISLSDSGGTGTTNLVLEIAEENLTANEREASIWFFGEGTDPVELLIHQAPYSISAAASSVQVGYESDTVEVDIISNGMWEASSTDDWITAEVAERSGIAAVSVAVEGNESADEREGSVIVAIGEYASDTIGVIQSGKPSSARFDETPDDVIVMYPNPTSGVFYLYTTDDAAETMEILDLSGTHKRSVSLTGGGRTRIDPGNLPAGTYMIKVTSPAAILIGTIILQR